MHTASAPLYFSEMFAVAGAAGARVSSKRMMEIAVKAINVFEVGE